MVYKFLYNWHKNIDYYIPDRYSEGYGISIKSIDYAVDNDFRLVIALDCGIKAVEKMKYANARGIDFIICDHHNPGDKIPEALAVLDPKRPDCKYPYKELSGCGVGFKLLQAYSRYANIDNSYLMRYIDFLAVSIASDIVPITGENRILMHYGLEKLNTDPHIGLRAINEVAEVVHGKIDVSDIVFKMGPRINAAGRIDSGQTAVDLLVCNDLNIAREISQRIDADNTTRKEIDREITTEASNLINLSKEMIDKCSTVLFNPSWHRGVVGIVASRLVEQFYRPTIIFTRSNGMITGSARSVSDFNIYEAISECSDLLENYGGHTFAAGLTLKEDNLQQFIDKFEEVVSRTILPYHIEPKVQCDAHLSISQISPKLWAQLKAFRPFGPGNMSPLFIARKVSGTGQCVGKNSAHLKLALSDIENPQVQFPAIAFNQTQHWQAISNKTPIDICYTIIENEYRGNFSIQLNIKDIKQSIT
jgi:single-stranded-DNA-specific exonuclease